MDCEQSLFFFRFSEGSARARERRSRETSETREDVTPSLSTFQLTVFGDHFSWFCCKLSTKFFFYRPVNTDKPKFVSFLVFAGAAASFTAKILSFETVAKREAILNPFPKQWISKDIPSYGSRTRENCYPLIWWIIKGFVWGKNLSFP